MHRYEHYTRGALIASALFWSGCGTPVEEPAATVAEGVHDANSATSRKHLLEVDLVSNPQPVAVEFAPPFPERTELFEPAKRAQSAVRRDDEFGNTVELKGFVNVGGPKAVLSIDGVVTPIGAGDERYGVQVISIDGVSVVLQRGRSRWTATLE